MIDTGADRSRLDAERDFWGHHLPPLEEALRTYREGPDAMTAAAFRQLEPLGGASVLDFACGTGITSAWLAAGGANVTGIDITPEAIERARQLCDAAGVEASFVCGDVTEMGERLPVFDRLFGNMALHHVNVAAVAPILDAHLAPGGVGCFVETTYSNPLFWMGRRFVAGRFGVPRYGSADEKPIGRRELAQLRCAFGEAAFAESDVHFARILDRQLLRFRYPPLSRLATSVDQFLAKWPRLGWLSYHRIIRATKQ